MAILPKTVVLVDYENARREAIDRQWYRLVPNLRAWTDHFVDKVPGPLLIRFYHGWYAHNLAPTDDLRALNVEVNDPGVRAHAYDAGKRVNVPGVIAFEPATTLWRNRTLLPTSRKHTTSDCPVQDCPKHGNPVQKMVDGMLVRDATEFSRSGVSVIVVSSDDDIVPAFPHANRYLVPKLDQLTPGQRQLQSDAPGMLDADPFPYSPNAWYARPLGIRRS